MPGQQDCRIFISYAHKDGAELAERLQRDLTEKGFDAWIDTQRLLGGAIWTTTIEQEIDSRQVTVALLTPSSYQSELCRAEQLRALRKGNRLIPVLVSKNPDRPLYLEARRYRDFSDPGDYQARFQYLLADIRGSVSASLRESFRETRTSYVTAPLMVANHIERPEALRAFAMPCSRRTTAIPFP